MSTRRKSPPRPLSPVVRGVPRPPSEPVGDYNPFLKADMIGARVGVTGTIEFLGRDGRSLDSEFGEQVAYPIRLNGMLYDFAVKIGSGNHGRLFKLFKGKNPKGKVPVVIKEFAGKHYLALVAREK